MATHLDIKLKKIQKQILDTPGPKPSTIDEFLSVSRFPTHCIFDIKSMFRDIVEFYRNVKQRTEPNLVIWTFIRDVMLDKFNECGDNPANYANALKRALGYDSRRPNEDWQSQAGKDAVGDRLDRQNEQVDVAEQRIDKQFSELREIPKEDLERILNNTPEENFIIHPSTHQRVKETDYFDERKEHYIRDFSFNMSADWPLLKEIITTEIQLARFDMYLRDHPNRFAAKHRDETFERLCKAQKALGISREQRVESEDAMKDTLADAVDTYERYLQLDVELEDLFIFEELQVLVQKYKRGVDRGRPEISEASFRKLSHGYSVEEAEAIINNPDNIKYIQEIEERAAKITL